MGVILAGGMSRRMAGKPKALLPINGKTFVEHLYERLAPQVDSLCISTNQPMTTTFAEDTAQIPDQHFPKQGPMSGILNAALYAQSLGYTHILIAPVDAPYLPTDWREKMEAAALDLSDSVIIPEVTNRLNYLFQWLPVKHTEALAQWLSTGGRAAKSWLAQIDYQTFFYQETAGNHFQNINTPEDYQRLLSEGPS